MWHRVRGSRGRGHSNRGGSSHGQRRDQWNFRGGNRGRGNPSRGFRGSYRSDYRQSEKSYKDDRKHDKKPADKFTVIEKLSEADIGVTEFISNLEGFTGVLKSRYSDFHVNEIDLDGQVAKLTDLKVPEDPEPVKEEEDDDVLVNRYRIEQLPTETWDKIHKMVQSDNKSEIIEIDVSTMTKEDRTKIHEAVKTVFGQKVVGSTITKEDKKFVTFKLFNKADRIDRREKWPKSRGGEYVYFLVYKEYTDTIEANIQISESLRMRPSSFCYAGVKDRRAKTTQWFCVRKIDPARIVERTKYLKNIRIGNFCYKKETLKLGQLMGNRFRIALRHVTAENNVIDKAMVSLRDNGFINYYGLQRFGNCKEVPTHEIGIQLLLGNWKEAVNLILKPRKHEQDKEVAAAKELYEKLKDAAKAYGKLEKKRNRCIEGKLLGGLMKHSSKDLVNALENVPRNMRLLYIHAYQSLVWNKIVTKRIKEFGLKPIVGDIVIDGDLGHNLEFIESNIDDNLGTEVPEETEGKEPTQKQVKVKILTETDLPNHTIYDVVLPLPGYDITYPDNVVKDWYSERLAADGLSLEMPKQRVKTYTLSGAYRKIVERVTNLSWKTMRYTDPTASLIRSDYEELMDKSEPKDISDGKYKSLIIDFCLPSSCYATMALREIMKMDTSVETHMNFGNSREKHEKTSERRRSSHSHSRSESSKDTDDSRPKKSEEKSTDSKSDPENSANSEAVTPAKSDAANPVNVEPTSSVCAEPEGLLKNESTSCVKSPVRSDPEDSIKVEPVTPVRSESVVSVKPEPVSSEKSVVEKQEIVIPEKKMDVDEMNHANETRSENGEKRKIKEENEIVCKKIKTEA